MWQYGLTAETTDDWVTMASALMEAYCRRPSLLVTQYVERMRLTAGAQTVRLSYRPLAAAAGAASALVGVQVRYGRPRRGELPDPFREQIAWAFSVPGSWNALDVTTVDVNETTAELTFPVNFLGLDYNEVEVTYTSGAGDDSGCGEGGLRADCEECAGDAGDECEVEQDGHDADAVLQRIADRSAGADAAEALCGREAGVRRWRICVSASVAAQRAADVLLRALAGGRCCCGCRLRRVLGMRRSSWGWRCRRFRMWSWRRWCFGRRGRRRRRVRRRSGS